MLFRSNPSQQSSSTSPLRFASDVWPTLHKPLIIVLNVKSMGTIFTLTIWSNTSKAHSVSPFLKYPPIKTDHMITSGYKLFFIISKNRLFAFCNIHMPLSAVTKYHIVVGHYTRYHTLAKHFFFMYLEPHLPCPFQRAITKYYYI